MARPIKETPVLTGNDARRFEQAIKRNETTKVSREAYERAMKTFENISNKTASCKPRGA
jgi:hypothetical protein